MRKAFRASAALALATMLGTAATPALADRGWYGGGHHRWHHGHDDGFGTFLGVAALFGAVAIIASSADRNSRARAHDGRYDSEASSSEDAAVDDCSVAARDEGSQDGYSAEVRDISGTEAIEGGWNVAGTIDQRDGDRDDVQTRRFTCTWRDGRVAEVFLSRDSIALR